jgi:hypothetical protein
MSPEMADPLGALEQAAHIGKGVNRAGDLAFVFVDPATVGGDEEKALLILVPVSDYQAFVGNVKNPKAQGDITEATSQEGDEQLYLAKWGTYAAVSQAKETLGKKPTGLKLQGAAVRESDTKDALLYANMAALKTRLLPQLQNARPELLKQVEQGLGGAGEGAKKFTPVVKALANQVLNMGQEFLTDARSATVGLNLTDTGLATTVMADFEPNSYLGKLASEMKQTDAPLTVGLPDRKYFAFGGATIEPKTAARVFGEILDPVAKELANVPEAKSINTVVNATKRSLGATNGFSIGYVAPMAALGQESILQAVTVVSGDAATQQAAQRESLQAMGDIMKMLPQQPNMTTEFKYTPGSKTVAGVQLDGFETKMNMPDDDPQAAQMKQIMAWVYGPNGMTGVAGVASPQSFVMIQGGPDALISDTIAAAKANANTVSSPASVKAVAAQLPQKRAMAFYVELDTLVTTGVRYAKGLGLPVNVRLPNDLPPIGMTAGAEQTAIRVDSFVPLDLVKGLVAAGLEAQKAMQNPNGGL